jgi:nitrate reductase gamma subunit
MDVYEFVRGPLAWIAFTICIGASLIRMGSLLARAGRINRMHTGKSLRGGVTSIVRGLLPMGLQAMRQQPFFGVATFVFHLCALMTPLFLLAHIVLVYESWQIQWLTLPDALADGMTLVVIAGAVYFGMRRVLRKEVRSLSKSSDWALLAVIAGTFLTGMLAYHHWVPYRPVLIIHIVLGELLLVVIPFSKLMHMVLFFFTRGYLGAEYEIVMKGEGL